MNLDPGILADVPHSHLIHAMATRCAADPRVLAIWVGGSLASGRGDHYSDIDFRIAVAPDTVEEWASPDWAGLLPVPPCGAVQLRFGAGMLLHHMVLADGTIVDFLVLETTVDHQEPDVVVLWCNDPDLRTRLEALATPAASLVKEVDPAVLRNFLVDYWIATHKQMKALARAYDESAFVGLYVERMALLRAWYMVATGKDIEARMSLHMLGALHKGLDGVLTPRQRELVGMPTRTPQEMIAAIEAVRSEMAATGRVLAERHEIVYPHELEAVVMRTWEQNKDALAVREFQSLP